MRLASNKGRKTEEMPVFHHTKVALIQGKSFSQRLFLEVGDEVEVMKTWSDSQTPIEHLLHGATVDEHSAYLAPAAEQGRSEDFGPVANGLGHLESFKKFGCIFFKNLFELLLVAFKVVPTSFSWPSAMLSFRILWTHSCAECTSSHLDSKNDTCCHLCAFRIFESWFEFANKIRNPRSVQRTWWRGRSAWKQYENGIENGDSWIYWIECMFNVLSFSDPSSTYSLWYHFQQNWSPLRLTVR